MNNLFKILESNGEKALRIIKNAAFSPENIKKLKTWGIHEASLLIKKSRQTLVDAEEKKQSR